MIDSLTSFLLTLSTLLGGANVWTMFMYYKQTRRLKAAEASEKEITANTLAIEAMQRQIDWQSQQITGLQAQVNNRDATIQVLYADKNTLEIKHAKNKGAINQAYSCAFCGETSKCPVLIKRTENEEEYLRQLHDGKTYTNGV